MTNPKDSKEIITNNGNNAVLNKQSQPVANINISQEIQQLINENKLVKHEEKVEQIVETQYQINRKSAEANRSLVGGVIVGGIGGVIPIFGGALMGAIVEDKIAEGNSKFSKVQTTALIKSANDEYETALTKTTQTLEKFARHYEQEKSNYETALKVKNEAITEKQGEVETLNTRLSDLKSETTKEIEAKNTELSNLQGERDREKNELQAIIDEKEGELTQTTNLKKDLEKEKSTTLAKLGELEKSKENLTTQLSSYTSELDQASKDKARLEREKGELEKSIQTLTNEKQVLIDNYNKVSRIKNELEKARDEAMELILNNSQLPEQKDLDLAGYRTKCHKLEQTNQAQRGIITSNAVSLQERDDQIQEAQNTLITMNDEITKLKRDLSELQAKFDNTEIDLKRANVNLEAKDGEINSLKAKIEKLETEITELEKKLNKSESNLESANRQLDEKTQEINNLNDQLQTRDETIRNQRNQLDRLNAERINFKDSETLWKGEIEKAQTKANNLEKRNDELEIKDHEKFLAIDNLTSEKNKLEDENKQKDLTIEEKETSISNLETEKTALSTQIDQHKTEITKLQTELKEIRDNINKHFWFNSNTAKEAANRLIDRNRDLKRYEPSIVHNIGDWTGINWLTNKIGSTFTVLGFGATTYVIGPMIFKAIMAWQTSGISLAVKRRKNNGNDNNGEEEPRPRNKKTIVEAIEAEPVKQLPEEVMDMEQETTEKEK